MSRTAVAQPLKGLLLAVGLSLVATTTALAQDAPVSLGTQATVSLASDYVNPPTGLATLGGHQFDLTSGMYALIGNSGSVSVTTSYANPTAVYVLMNTSNTYDWFYAGMTVGQVKLTFSNGTSQTVPLVVGSNIREWRIGAVGTVNTVTDSASSQVWSGFAQGATLTAATIDMLTLSIPANTNTLTGVSVSNLDTWGNLRIRLSGITVAYSPPAPTTSKHHHKKHHHHTTTGADRDGNERDGNERD